MSTETTHADWSGPRTKKTFLGHPVGLFVLFFTEMWERFSYYGMRGLLKLYMANYLFVTTRQVLQGGTTRAPGDPDAVLGWSVIRNLLPSGVNEQASVVYGWYSGLVYLTPLLGGILADRYFGQRKAVYLGAILMACGQFVLFGAENMFFVGLLLLILGNGLFKPNISTQVGSLYPPGDPRRDGAFTIFYMGINLGAFICNLVCGTLAALYGWRYGYLAAGIGMLVGLAVQLVGVKHLAPDTLAHRRAAAAAATAAPPEGFTKEEWRRIFALIILCGLNVIFWAVYEQQGNTMQTWADEQTVWPTLGSFQVPSTWFQSFNPLFIFIMAPLSTIIWAWQARRGSEPSSVAKMAIGCFILGLSFIVMVVGSRVVGTGKGSVFWPVFCTLLLTVGELYLSPVGLSLVTKVAPARIVSMMMGTWFLSSFFGNLLSGYIGALYTRMPKDYFFLLLLALGVAAGVAIWAFNKPLKQAMGAKAG
ncbi:MAG: peptide MFS transporter [Deltaproteobacteria bacterium]|nr:peptide MFS transporter [Deltaproteobacteria bacterium]